MAGNERVLIRNRETAFIMLRLQPLRRMRRDLTGLQLARAIGLYVLISKRAHDHGVLTGGHEPLRMFRGDLGTDAGIADRQALSGHLRRLADCKVIEIVDRVGPRGPEPSEWKMPATGPAWVALQVRCLEALRAGAHGSVLLGRLALYVALHDLANDARAARGGLQTLSSYREISARCGLSVRSLADHKDGLVDAGVLNVTKVTSANGANAPQLWDLVEPDWPARLPDSTTARNADSPAAEIRRAPSQQAVTADADSRHTLRQEAGRPPAKTRRATPQEPDTPAAEHASQHEGSCEGDRLKSAGPYARVDELFLEEDLSEPLRTHEPQAIAPAPPPGGSDDAAIEVCELMSQLAIERTTPRLIERPQSWARARTAWLDAAREILDFYPAARVRTAIEYVHADRSFLGSRILTMSQLAKDIDMVMVRASGTSTAGATSTQAGQPGAMPWAQAWERIQRAIARHGSDGQRAAIAELDGEATGLAEFARAVGWRELCHGDARYAAHTWRQTYERLAATHRTTERRDAA